MTRPLIHLLLTCLTLLPGMVSSARADIFVVTSTASVGPGTFYEALVNAGDSVGPHAIHFNLPPDSRITLMHPLPPIVSDELDIDGMGSPGLIIDGGGVVRLFLVAAPNRVFRLANMEVQRGLNTRAGGCLLAQQPSNMAGASITLNRVIMRDCEVRRAASNEWVEGGAVSVAFRDLIVVDSQFHDNRAHTVDTAAPTIAAGGAIAAELGPDHLARIEFNHFSGNQVTGLSATGGGCCRAQGAAVDIRGSGVLSLIQNRFTGNTADTLDDSTPWGAVVKAGVSTSMSGNLFFDNHNSGTMIQIDDYAANSFANVSNNTLVANSTQVSAALQIGGIKTTIVRNNTFLSWRGDSYPAPHLRIIPPHDLKGTVVLSHNVLSAAESRWPHPDRPICYVHDTLTTSHHHNLVLGLSQGCGPAQDPELVSLHVEALRDNGGEVETVSFLQGSPVIDGGNPLPPDHTDTSRCLTHDARVRPRPRDGDGDGTAICDLGAWESQGEAALFHHDFEQVLWRP